MNFRIIEGDTTDWELYESFKDLLSKRLLEHKLENSRSTMNGHKLMDYEIDIFIRKYSYFTSLFDKL